MNISQRSKKSACETTCETNSVKVVSLFSDHPYQSHNHCQIVRLAPELDRCQAIYADTDGTGKEVYRANILFWALLSDNSIVGMIPWLNKLIYCGDLNYPNIGAFLGYFDPGIDALLTAVPQYKRLELEMAADHFHVQTSGEEVVIQELPDTCGTHAIFSTEQLQSFIMSEVFSWQLLSNGRVQAMFINLSYVKSWPPLLGDQALVACQSRDDFYGFLPYRLAVKLKQTDQGLKQYLDRLISSQASYAKLLHSHIKR